MLYLAQWQGSGTHADHFRPAGIDQFRDAPHWGAFDMRPDPTVVDGYGIVSVPGFSGAVSGWVKIGAAARENMGPAVRTALANRLGLDLSSGITLRDIFEQIAFEPGRKWRSVIASRAGVKRLHIAGEEFGFRQYAVPANGELIDPTDDFNRANENPLSQGGNWAAIAGWNHLRVVGNQVMNDGSAIDSVMKYTGFLPANDQFCEVDYVSGLSDGGPMTRIDAGGAQSGYLLDAYPVNFNLATFTNGVYGDFARSTDTVVSGNRIRLESVGSSHTALINGVVKVGPTTNTAFSSGYTGLHIYEPALVFDNWQAGDIGSGPVIKQITGSGGIQSAGAATAKHVRKMFPAGGISSSGAATAKSIRKAVGAGGIQSGGAAVGSSKRRMIPTGGIQASGGATYTLRLHATGAGGLQSGGAAGNSSKRRAVGTGGITAAGIAAASIIRKAIGAGGIQSGGAADVQLVGKKAIVGSGGIVSSGTAPASLRRGFIGTGGLSSSGVASSWVVRRAVGSGGLNSSGAATFRRRFVAVATGGIQSGGAADATLKGNFSIVGSGGLVSGGAAASNTRRHAIGTGGLSSSGAALSSRRVQFVPSGGLTAGGQASAFRIVHYTAAGGISSSGAAVARFISGLILAPFLPESHLVVKDTAGRLQLTDPAGRLAVVDSSARLLVTIYTEPRP